MRINKHDTNGTKPLLDKGELGYDDYTVGGDAGRVYVGTGSVNIPQAKKAEVVAVDGKVDTHVVRVDNPHSVTKIQVGLGSVDNTSDINKPISTAVQTALDTKQAVLVSGTNIKTIEGQSIVGSGNIDLSKSDVGLSNVDNTADATKNVLSATKLTTARTINGVSFDGTANITITDSTKLPVSGKAADSELLDGRDSTGYLYKTGPGSVNSYGFNVNGDNQVMLGYYNTGWKNTLEMRGLASNLTYWDSTGSAKTIWNSGNMGSGSGLDADLLDGSDSIFFLQSKNLGNGDVNSILTSGMYRLEASANSPISGYGNILSVRGSATSTILADTIGQIAFDCDTGDHYIRGGQIGNSSGVAYLPTVAWGKILTGITPIGYVSNAGVGGIVYQGTSKATDVTLNKLCGDIILSNSMLSAGNTVYFKLVNSFIGVGDMVDVAFVASGIDNTRYYIFSTPEVNGGYTYIVIKNTSLFNLEDPLRLRFSIRKGANS